MSETSLRITIATSGRFHVLDLARELRTLGHAVLFYTLLPVRRAESFGLPRACVRSLFFHALPWLTAARLIRNPCRRRRIRDRLTVRLDRVVARLLGPSDVFIGMSGLFVEAGWAARRRYGALWVLERGSRHILSQKAILDALPEASAHRVSDFDVERELAGYEAADVIVIPSRHAEESFLERGVSGSKLFRNMYGVDLQRFVPTKAPDGPLTILFVGAWSYRKGADILAQAVATMSDARLLHAGPIEDAPVPRADWFHALGPLPQHALPSIMAQGHLLALASREDGFGMVLLQALACGLPVAATDRTGGPDLADLLPDPSYVSLARAGEVESFRKALESAGRKALDLRGQIRNGLGSTRSLFSWSAYAERYERFLQERLGGERR